MPTRARRPDLQPYVDAIESHMRENNLSQAEMAEMIYGHNEKGEPRLSHFYPTAHGRSRPQAATIARIKEKTGLDLSTVKAHSAVFRAPATPAKAPPDPPTPAKAALAQFAEAKRASSARAPPPSTIRVSFTVTRTSGETVLSLSDVTGNQAVKVLRALMGLGLA